MDMILPAANYQQERSNECYNELAALCILDCLQNLGQFRTAVEIAFLPRL
jgi:hypothetical protein